MQKPWLSPEFVKSLAQFEIVLHLHLYFPTLIGEAVELYPLCTDLQECLSKDLGHGAWARLQKISVRGSEYWVQLDRQNNWVPGNGDVFYDKFVQY
jgi:hypothetical protein